MESDRSRNVSLLLIAVIAGFVFLTLLSAIGVGAWFTPEAGQIRKALRDAVLKGAEIIWWAGVLACTLGFTAAALRLLAWAMDNLTNAAKIMDELGVIPQMFLPPVFHKWLTEPVSLERERTMKAAANGGVTRWPPVKMLMPDMAPEVVPDPQTEPPVPSYANVYTSALPPKLALPIGESAHGQISVPLDDLGCIVIGGLQGMGKSECVASMIVNLMRQDPNGERVRLAVSDLKGGLDFGHIPHDLAVMEYPVARSQDAVLDLTRQVWTETQRRQGVLFSTREAHIETYNKRHTAIPFLLFVIDELMMMSMGANDRGASSEDKRRSEQFNSLLIKIAAEGRATGVFVIAATQKPSAEVIPTQFRDLCGIRIAFWCSRNFQSTAILGESGAEILPRDPGLALVAMGNDRPVQVRAYHAGIREKRFLSFTERQPRADRLALPRDAEGDGTGADDLPDGTGYAVHAETPSNGRYAGIAYRVPGRDEPLVDYDEVRHRALWNVLRSKPSIKGAQAAVPNEAEYSGGTDFYLVREVLRRGRAGNLPWMEGRI